MIYVNVNIQRRFYPSSVRVRESLKTLLSPVYDIEHVKLQENVDQCSQKSLFDVVDKHDRSHYDLRQPLKANNSLSF